MKRSNHRVPQDSSEVKEIIVKEININRKWLVCISVLVLSVTGCASVDPKPFVKFNSVVKEAATGIDSAMSVNYDWTRSAFVESFSNDPSSTFSQLVIQVGDKYSWRVDKPPIYLDIKRTRSTLCDLNNAFTEYADLLVKLSGGELIKTDRFDQLAEDLNKNASDAARALNVSATSAELSLFSTAASEAARRYIENKRQGDLIDALRKNQENVQKYSNLCIELIHITRGNMKAYYVEKYEPIRKAWNAAPGEKRQKQTEAMLALNEQFTNALGVLQEVEVTYRAIPKAHADLSKAMKDSKSDLGGIQQLYSSGLRLQRRYTDLKKANLDIQR